MIKGHIYILLMLILLCLSCGVNNNYEQVKIEVEKGALDLKISENSPNISHGLQGYHFGDNDYLFSINWLSNSLQLYDLHSKELVKETNFSEEGPSGVGKVFGFYVLGFDSIFLFTQRGSEIILTDTSGIIKNRVTYYPPDFLSNAFVHNSYFISNPILDGDKMIVKAHIEGDYREMTQSYLQQLPLGYSINLNTGKVEAMGITYPYDYMPNGMKFFEYSMASDGDKIVFSLFGDHRLFFSERGQLQTLNSVNASSEFLDEILPIFPISGERMDTYGYLFASDHYESLLYDSFRNVYYRIAVPKAEFSSEEELRDLRTAQLKFSVIVLNRDLEVLGEHLFEDEMYLPQNIFIGSAGLYVSTNHPKNTNVREDFMTFDCLKVSF